MTPFDDDLKRLAAAETWSYGPGQPSAAEPAAWAALAMVGHGLYEEALRPARWLADLQQDNGAVGMSVELDAPRWCTSLAMLAWNAVDAARGESHFATKIEAAARWALDDRGKTNPRDPRIGHDTTLIGWSWAADTHSWLEPTCFFVSALRVNGIGPHPRITEGLRLIRDRVLPDGGANYGNTWVLGQTLVPHVQSSGIVLLALAPPAQGVRLAEDRAPVSRTIQYLLKAVTPRTSCTSLAFALLGLSVQGMRPDGSDRRIAACLGRLVDGDPSGPAAVLPLSLHESALLLLAAEPAASWFSRWIATGVPGAPA